MKESAGRVLMLVEGRFPADIRVRNEAVTLAENGYRVTVVALAGSSEQFHEVVYGISVYRIPRLNLFKKLPGRHRSAVAMLLVRLQAVVGYFVEYVYFTAACLVLSLYVSVKEGLDVIHAHNPPDTLFIVGAVHKLFGRKFVFDHHDLSPELYRSRYQAPSGFVSRVLGMLERMSLRLADVAIATNESYRAIDIERNGVDPKRVFVVRNGPNLRRVKLVEPDQALKNNGRAVLGYVGAMNPQDGVDYLLRALRYLARDLGRTDFYCVLVGDGDSLDDLKSLAVDLGIADRVLFTGFIPDEQMVRYLSTADICLDPNPSSPLNDVSTWIKVMEYMALAKPVVSFDLKETRISAADAAVYATPNDEAEFARAIAKLMDDPVKRRQMGDYGRARVMSDLSWHVTSRNLLSAYGFLFPTTLSL